MIDPRIFIPIDEIMVDNPIPDGRPGLERYIGPSIAFEMVSQAERSLGVKLPESYLELLQISNGGFLRYSFFPTDQKNSWHDGFVEISDIQGIGYPDGLDSELGSKYLCEEWGYPENMVYLSGDGHTGFFLDYRICGPSGEPSVAWLDVEEEPTVDIQLAATFSDFLSCLQETEPPER